MKSMLGRRVIGIGAAFALLAGCGGGSQPPVGAPGAMPQALTIAPKATNNLYVANEHYNYAGTVPIYASRGRSPARTISQGIGVPLSLAFDSSQNLYVANYVANTVTVYAPSKSSVLRTISQGLKGPFAVAFNPRSGNLFVSNQLNSTVTIYKKGSQKLLQTISQGIASPTKLAFDSSGNCYVSNTYTSAGTVTVYAFGSTKLQRTISQGVSQPSDLPSTETVSST